MDQRKSATLRRKQGHLNATEMAMQLGVNRFTYFYWLERGLIPKPSVTFTGRRRYYGPKDIDMIRGIMKGNNDSK